MYVVLSTLVNRVVQGMTQQISTNCPAVARYSYCMGLAAQTAALPARLPESLPAGGMVSTLA